MCLVIGNMTPQLISELQSFKIDPEIKNVHLSVSETQRINQCFAAERGTSLTEDPRTVDHLITIFRQIKSAINFIFKLKNLDNVSCKFVRDLSNDVEAEYSLNLGDMWLEEFQKMFRGFLGTLC